MKKNSKFASTIDSLKRDRFSCLIKYIRYMKKIFAAIVFCTTSLALASAIDQGIGLRFNSGYRSGAEVSYQMNFSTANRLEADFGFEYEGGFACTGIYHWVYDLSDLAEGFAWFVGPGAELRSRNKGVGAGIVGQIGLEYTIPTLPLQFALDSRPGIFFGANGHGDWGAAFSIRYLF